MVGVRLCDNRQILFLRMSGEDTRKTIRERVDALKSLLWDFLDYDVRYAGKIRSLTVQGISEYNYNL